MMSYLEEVPAQREAVEYIEKFYGNEEKPATPAPTPQEEQQQQAQNDQSRKLVAIQAWAATLIDNELRPKLIEVAKQVKASSTFQE